LDRPDKELAAMGAFSERPGSVKGIAVMNGHESHPRKGSKFRKIFLVNGQMGG